ncbi:MAG: polyprenyl synthetase family protein [Salinivirgaceae bacterium]|nr:polyprenyl synthetase family protein [Salinivirgaceae bacterium]
MNGTELKLIVPQKTEIRKEIRSITDSFFASETIVPPVSYEKLTQYAQQLIEKNNWGFDNFAFTLLCCGNAIWRSVVETIPFNRRVLLLPECLKNSTLCKAESDELGLLCKECGACSISGILKHAEELGYIALVTEGTTVTTKLIEAGKIDAVIGVGCMESLQKMFSTVAKHAIPGLGIPLLGNGCVDTMTDVDWLKAEISQISSAKSMNVINLEELRTRVKSIFNTKELQKIIGQGNSKTEQISRDVLLSGGNRWRPFLTSLVYESVSENPQKEISNQMAVCVECFHKASLVHDDIEDYDITRNGSETIHTKYGIPVGLNVGDLLIGEGYKLISKSNLSHEIKASCLQVAAEGHVALSIGQGEELISLQNSSILSIAEIIEIFKNKTGAAFKVSLLLGATAGEASPEIKTLLTQFSEHLGIAYQIKDDLADFNGKLGDIIAHKFSILLSVLKDSVDNKTHTEIEELIIKENTENIFQLIENHEVRKKTELLLKNYIDKAYKSLEPLINVRLKLALHEIMGNIFSDYL